MVKQLGLYKELYEMIGGMLYQGRQVHLDYYHTNKGYLIRYNFNQKMESGVKEIQTGEKVIVEAVV